MNIFQILKKEMKSPQQHIPVLILFVATMQRLAT